MNDKFKPLLNHGEPELVKYIVDRIQVAPNGCWLWTGGDDGNGYGRVSFHYKARVLAGKVKLYGSMMPRAHVATYCCVHGTRPQLLDHFVCDNKQCCNPWHVRPEEFTANVLRGTGPTAINKRKTHCPQGHEYTQDNIKWVGPKKENRRCKICFNADRSRRRKYLVSIGLSPYSKDKSKRSESSYLVDSKPHTGGHGSGFIDIVIPR